MAIPLTVVIQLNKLQIGKEVLKVKHPMSTYGAFPLWCTGRVGSAIWTSIGLPRSIRNLLEIVVIYTWEIVHFSEGVFAGIEAVAFGLISAYLLLYLVRIRHVYVRLKNAVC